MAHNQQDPMGCCQRADRFYVWGCGTKNQGQRFFYHCDYISQFEDLLAFKNPTGRSSRRKRKMKNNQFAVLVLLLVSLLMTSCAPATPQASIPVVPEVDYWPTDGWQTSTPEQQGMDSEQLAQMFDTIQKQKINLHSLLIIRNGYMVTEAYFDPYNAHIRHHGASLTKSVIGALVGIAIDQGKIQGVDQKVLEFFSDGAVTNLDARKQSMTLEHLLSLSSGLDLPDFTAKPQMEQSTDWVQFSLGLPMASQPGTRFGYGNEPVHLLSAILQKTTGKETRLFANQNLFDPLGIAPAMPGDWGADPQGTTTGGIGL
jgi:CubicO group peptidase (beta-lactamase class C family)